MRERGGRGRGWVSGEGGGRNLGGRSKLFSGAVREGAEVRIYLYRRYLRSAVHCHIPSLCLGKRSATFTVANCNSFSRLASHRIASHRIGFVRRRSPYILHRHYHHARHSTTLTPHTSHNHPRPPCSNPPPPCRAPSAASRSPPSKPRTSTTKATAWAPWAPSPNTAISAPTGTRSGRMCFPCWGSRGLRYVCHSFPFRSIERRWGEGEMGLTCLMPCKI